MIIEDKIPDKERIKLKVNNNIIYLVDYEIELIRFVKLKKGKVRKVRRVVLLNELHENNPSLESRLFYEKQLRTKVKAKERESMEIKKVILKKEISCSFYER